MDTLVMVAYRTSASTNAEQAVLALSNFRNL
jgi:hypothetical protein